MKTFKHITLVLIVLSIILLSCKKETDDDSVDGNLNASYELKIDGNTISSNTSIPLGMLLDASGVASQVSVTEPGNTFMMMFTDIPTTSGDIKQLDDNTLIALTGSKVVDYQENFEAVVIDAGTMTRTANDKVSFAGTFVYNGITFTTTGFIKSDGLKEH